MNLDMPGDFNVLCEYSLGESLMRHILSQGVALGYYKSGLQPFGNRRAPHPALTGRFTTAQGNALGKKRFAGRISTHQPPHPI